MSKETVKITLKPGFGAQRSIGRTGLGKFISGKTKECAVDSGDLLKVRAMAMFDVNPPVSPEAKKKAKAHPGEVVAHAKALLKDAEDAAKDLEAAPRSTAHRDQVAASIKSAAKQLKDAEDAVASEAKAETKAKAEPKAKAEASKKEGK